jgi:hypothetical protein
MSMNKRRWSREYALAQRSRPDPDPDAIGDPLLKEIFSYPNLEAFFRLVVNAGKRSVHGAAKRTTGGRWWRGNYVRNRYAIAAFLRAANEAERRPAP